MIEKELFIDQAVQQGLDLRCEAAEPEQVISLRRLGVVSVYTVSGDALIAATAADHDVALRRTEVGEQFVAERYSNVLAAKAGPSGWKFVLALAKTPPDSV